MKKHKKFMVDGEILKLSMGKGFRIFELYNRVKRFKSLSYGKLTAGKFENL